MKLLLKIMVLTSKDGLDENKNVTEAALEVGYESVSQFTREYKKMFGKTPKEDTQWLRGNVKK